MLQHIFKEIKTSRKLSEISLYITSSNTFESISLKKDGIYPVYDASGISAKIDEYDIESDYIAIIKDGSGVGRLQYCVPKSSIIGTLGAIQAIDCSTKYLYAALQTINFSKYVTGATIPHIYYKEYKNELIPFPDSSLQCKIATLSNCYDKKIICEERALSYLLSQKQALLQQIFI